MLIATAAAGLILSGAVAARAAGEKTGGDTVNCAGINACKGQGACAGAGHSCAGKNSCKGQGWVESSKDECLKKGGKIVEGKKE
jgi:uncharacterized membrane protein